MGLAPRNGRDRLRYRPLEVGRVRLSILSFRIRRSKATRQRAPQRLFDGFKTLLWTTVLDSLARLTDW
jgi:hypothetical protein